AVRPQDADARRHDGRRVHRHHLAAGAARPRLAPQQRRAPAQARTQRGAPQFEEVFLGLSACRRGPLAKTSRSVESPPEHETCQGGFFMSFDAAANRRRFLKFLAASPLLAAGAGPALGDTLLLPKPKQPDPLMWGPFDPADLIKNPKEAINVFDF